MKNILISVIAILLFSSFYLTDSLKGVYEYAGGIYNGKPEGAPAEYILQRKYNAKHYEAFLLEKGEKARKYEAGDYTLNADTCLETQTFSAQDSKTTGVTIRYRYSLHNDTLIFDGTLPNGTAVHEYWKKLNK